ncbi:MAG: hypothetical protein HRT98_00010 [Mycoplasmatales bacterium]|nr:hypothetical protein [Mycoplasmatales bacterium]
MKKTKKYMLSIGAITAIAVPATIAIASTSVDTQKNLPFNNIKGNSLQTFGSLSTYQTAAKNKPKLIKPAFKSVNKFSTDNGFMKEFTLKNGEIKTFIGNSGGLWEVAKNGTIKNLFNSYSLENGFMEKIYGNIYLGTDKNGIMIFNPVDNTLKHIGFDGVNARGGFMKKIDGRIYFGGNDGLKQVKYSNTTGQFSLETIISSTTSLMFGWMVKGPDDNLYVGSMQKGIFKVDVDAKKITKFGKMRVDFGWVQELEGDVYIGCATGLYKFTKNGLILLQADNFQESFLKKIDGIYYTGVKFKGLHVFENNKLDGTLVKISDMNTEGFLEKTQSGVYFGTANKGLFKLDFSLAQQGAVNGLLQELATGQLSQNDQKLSEIVKKINTKEDIEKYLGVTLSKYFFSSIISIKANVESSGKSINLKVELATKGISKSTTFSHIYAGMNDATINKIIAQKKVVKEITRWVTNKKITNSNGKKVSELANEMFKQPNIGKKVEFLKEISGIDLNAITKGSVTVVRDIQLTADPATGDISIKVTTYTPDVPNNLQDTTGLLKGDSDLTFQHKSNVKKLNEIVKKLKIKNQNVDASKIHDIKTLKKETGVDLTNLPSSSQYIVKAVKTKDGVLISVQVMTSGAVQTNEITTFKIKKIAEAKKGLGAGAVAGIVIGVLIAIFGIGAGIIIKKKKNKANNENNDDFMNKIESLD